MSGVSEVRFWGVVSVGFGTGFVVIEADEVTLAPDSTSASSSSCRSLALYSLGRVNEEKKLARKMAEMDFSDG